MKAMWRMSVVLLLAQAIQSARADTRVRPTMPNILFLCMDDLKPELGCYGSATVKTPNIDRLAQQGVLFEHHYVQQAVCGPSRASMFSGLRPDTTKVWDLQHTCREECPQAFTMQEHFRKAGYQTAGSGKIMHGFKNDDPASWSIPFVNPENLPYADGRIPALFQQYQGKAIHDAVKDLEKSGLKKYKEKQRFMAERNAKPSTECLDLPDDAYSDGAMTKWGIGMLESFAKSDQPFFLTLGYRKPHLPFVAPKKYWDRYDRKAINLAPFQEMPQGAPAYAYHPGYELGGYSDIDDIKNLKNNPEKQRELIHGYYACVSYVDAQIGKVLDALAETGLSGNTIIVLWGDHGWHLGDHGIWCKHSTYEQAARSPLIIVSPMMSTGTSSASVESVDIFPTLCELVGIAVPDQLEGISLVPVLKDLSARVKDFSMSQYPDHQRKGLMGYSMRTERYRLVVWVPESVSRTGKFDKAQIDAVELYDYRTDPLETVSLAENPEFAPVLKAHLDMLSEWFKGNGSLSPRL